MSVYIPPSIPTELHPKVSGLVGDPAAFCRLHQVQDKESKRAIPFEPLPMQVKIFNAVKRGHKRILVIKARQVAATTGRVSHGTAGRQQALDVPPAIHPAAQAGHQSQG